MEPRCNF